MTRLSLLTLASIPIMATAAAEETKLCVYDPAGTTGASFQLAQDYQLQAKAQGVSLELVPYTDESTAAADLAAGQCGMALITGLRARQFALPTATLEAMGALPSYDLLKTSIRLLASDSATALNQTAQYVNAGIYPAGAVYLFVKNRSWSQKSHLAGRKVATISSDDAARRMVDVVGASKVSADIGTFASMFNNGAVDIAYSPATAFGPLELYRGLSGGGGIIRYPVSQLTFQLVARSEAVSPSFAAWSRSWTADQFDRAMRVVRSSESDIAADLWVDIPTSEKPGYEQMFQDVRVSLREEGVYHGTMLTLMKRVRCRADASRTECTTSPE